MSYNLDNKKIFITGAAGGIGSAICDKFIEKKSILICTASNNEKLLDLKNKYGSDHFYYLLDLSNMSSISETVNQIVKDHKIDVLINNAGTTKDNLLLRMSDEQWNSVINLNLNSNFYIIKSILPSMVKSKAGIIIGITSLVALTGNPGQANYTASKSAMISMYKSIALEVAQRNIRVNLIAPGFIQSPMTDKLNVDQVNAILAKIPQKKLGTAKDIANMAAFLSTEECNYITGQTFHINGGMLMV